MELCYKNNKKSLFRKYAKLLTSLTKHQAFRDFVMEGTMPLPEKVALLLPNGYHEHLGGNHFRMTVTTGDVYGYKLESALKTIDFFNKNKWYSSFGEMQRALIHELADFKMYKNPFGYRQEFARLRYLTSTFNPNTSGTGQVRNTVADSTAWADVRGAANGSNADPSTAPYMDNYKSGGNFVCARGYTPFDTSSLTADATITAGANTIGLYFTGRTDNDDLSFSIFASTQASNTTLAVGDFSLVGTTHFITAVNVTDITLNAVNTYTLNASGDSNISKTGWSKFAHRCSADYNNVAPTLLNSLQFTGSGANAPVLTVTYTLPEVNVASSFFFM